MRGTGRARRVTPPGGPSPAEGPVRHSSFVLRHSSRVTSSGRGGFTLLEVLLALFIVATAAVILIEGYTQNLRAINANRVDTTLTLLAQWKMSEIAAGVISADLQPDGSFEEDGYPGYEWRIETVATETPGLSEVAVTARLVTEQTTRAFTLHRLVYVPEDALGLDFLP